MEIRLPIMQSQLSDGMIHSQDIILIMFLKEMELGFVKIAGDLTGETMDTSMFHIMIQNLQK